MPTQASSDVLIVGGGVAALSLALQLADHADVAIVTKAELTEGASLYAQGGIAAVMSNDAAELTAHIDDTLVAGAGLCRREAVEYVVRHGYDAIRWLIDQGVPFTQKDESQQGAVNYHLTQEGGHSRRRVFHAADATGQAIENNLAARVRNHPGIQVHENLIAIDLITRHKLGFGDADRCLGLHAFEKSTGAIRTFSAQELALATGGASKVYLYTSNPDTSTGDGIAMAWRAGCRVANMEFMQFHPTCLYHPQAKSFLISEAVRGEGGRLLLPDGQAFMHTHDDRGELAARDIVARAIDYEMKRGGLDHVLLDISHKPADFITTHFPNIHRRCLQFGYDMTREPLPVVPAAHYTCGGIMTDLKGQTDLNGLHAIGECTFTGLHGANRLASNSLLECVVMAHSAASDLKRRLQQRTADRQPLPSWDESRVTDADERIVVSHNWAELRQFMWDYIGIVRTTKRLQRAQHRIDLLKEEIREYYSNFKVNADLIELRNLVLVAELIVRSALARRESRGLHFTRDYPTLDSDTPPRDTVLIPSDLANSVARVNA
ncbi:MAG: L-aspartate oxidase [Acidiferrobacterales bacterium]